MEYKIVRKKATIPLVKGTKSRPCVLVGKKLINTKNRNTAKKEKSRQF